MFSRNRPTNDGIFNLSSALIERIFFAQICLLGESALACRLKKICFCAYSAFALHEDFDIGRNLIREINQHFRAFGRYAIC